MSMIHKSAVYLLLIVQLITFLHVYTGMASNSPQSLATTTQNNSSIANNLHLQLFTNTSYISAGDTINVTYAVYYSNFTFQSGISISFTFNTTSFYKISTPGLSSFLIKVNSSYNEVQLLGSITNDQQSLTFFNIDQKPHCTSSCLGTSFNVSQLQVFNDFSSIFFITIQTNAQFFSPTDIIQAKIVNLGLIIYTNQTQINNFGYVYSFIINKTIEVTTPILKPGTFFIQFSFYSTYYNPISVTKQVTVASSAIGYNLPSLYIDRLNIGEQPKDFVTYSLNFDITNLKYNYFISNNASIVYSQTGFVTNSLLKVPISVAFYYPVGQFFLNLELLKNNSILYTKFLPITIYDNIITSLIFNNELTDNQLSINFNLDTFIEDTLINYPSSVTIFNNDTNQQLAVYSIYGNKTFTLTFANSSRIPKILRLETKTNNSLYYGSTNYYPIYNRKATSITTNYNGTIQVQRLENVNIQVKVTTSLTNQSITTGMVDLSIDSFRQSEINLQNLNTFNYVVPANFTIGKHSLIVLYLGNDNLRPTSISYDYYVYSNVHFSDIKVNNTFTNPTTPILIQGYVLDENNTGVVTKISILDSNNSIIDQTVSNSEGFFSFIIINNNILGYYNYELRAETVNYYRTAIYSFNLFQNNLFNVNIVANQTMGVGIITVKGDIYGKYLLIYYTDLSNNFNIMTLNLDSKGTIQTNFLTPNVLGPIFFNVTNINNPSQSWIKKFILYKTPTISIVQLNTAYVGESVNISITADVFYKLFFNDLLVSNQALYINKTFLSIRVDTKGINILKLVFPSSYLNSNQYAQEIFVYEKIQLLQNLPEKINENTNITTYLQVVNNMNIPVGNLQIEFLYTDKVLFNLTMDSEGNLQAYISINDELDKYSFKILDNKAQYVNEEVFPINSTLIRTLTVTSDIAQKSFNDLTSTAVNFVVLFKNTGLPALLVNMTVEIIGPNQESDILHVTTNNNGIFTITINKPVGTYVISVITNNPNFIMSKSIYTIKVVGFNAIDNPFILPTILLSVAGIFFILKKKVF